MNIKIVRTENNIFFKLPATACEAYLKAESNGKYGWLVTNKYILPFIIEKKAIFKKIVFTHETICMDESENLTSEKQFLNDVVAVCKSMNVDFIGQPKTGVVFRIVPDGAISCNFGTYILDLNLSIDELFVNLHVKHRNVIRKAQKDGVTIQRGSEYLDLCAELISETLERQGIKYHVTKNTLEKLQNCLGKQMQFYVAYKDGIPQGCAIFIFSSGGKSYYLHGGSISKPYTGSLNLLQWEAIMDMKNQGVAIYDFVGARVNPKPGSKQESIQRFKSRFGAQLNQGYLWKYPINKTKYQLYYALARMVCFFRRQPYLGDIIDQENNINSSE